MSTLRAEACSSKSIKLEASDGASQNESQPGISAQSAPPESSYTWVAEHEQVLGLSRSNLLSIWAERARATTKQVKPLLRWVEGQ